MKIGIITYYYKSHNYGGCLQAFALCHALNEIGYSCEQISYDYDKPIQKRKNGIRSKTKRLIKKGINLYFAERYKKFDSFRDQIPHSEIIYNDDTVSSSVRDYDCFITGSDQVWNFKFFDPCFFLEFAPDTVTKIAYAVSLGNSRLSEEQAEYTEKQIQRFSDVSFREKDFIRQLSEKTGKRIEHVPDPVFLIKREHWNALAEKRIVEGKYVFCHFIGDDQKARETAKNFAKENGMQLVVLPHPSRINKHDLFYGDISIREAGPYEFLSLIKNAEYVFTDSFHCASFSVIFNKQFFAFSRLGCEEMAVRIRDLTETFSCSEHFIDGDPASCRDHINSTQKTDYSNIENKLEEIRQAGLNYLIDAIEKGSGR